jgi:hypothetical protein
VSVNPAFQAVDGQRFLATSDVNRAVDVDDVGDGDPAGLRYR